jgi:hypothetical protein
MYRPARDPRPSAGSRGYPEARVGPVVGTAALSRSCRAASSRAARGEPHGYRNRCRIPRQTPPLASSPLLMPFLSASLRYAGLACARGLMGRANVSPRPSLTVAPARRITGSRAMSRYPSRSLKSLRHPWSAMMASTLALAAMLAWPTAGSAGRADVFAPCRNVHPRARTQPPGQLFAVSHLRVSGMSCARAAAAVRAGVFDLVPAGPSFHTPGFRCRSPVGPPLPGTPTRLFSCRRSQQRFTFTVPGFS